MATYTPPPYFPQGSLAPPDPGRYKRFKLAVVGISLILVVILAGVLWGLWHLLRWLL